MHYAFLSFGLTTGFRRVTALSIPRRHLWRRASSLAILAGLLFVPRPWECNAAQPSEASERSPAPVAASEQLPKAIDLRSAFQQWELAPRRQGGRPTCSAFVVAGALEFAVAKRQGHGTRLSVEFLNWAANKECGDTNDGGFFSDLWKGFATHGICTEEGMPYQARLDSAQPPSTAALADAKTRLALGLRLHWIKEWNVKTGLTDDQFMAIKRTLSQGWPVGGGLRWPKQAQWTNDVLQMCPADAVYDGHSILLVGYREDPAQPGGGVFIFRNTSGNGRDGYMPYAYAQTYMNDAVWVDYEAQSKRPTASVAPFSQGADNTSAQSSR